jgi:hypothetical protein
LSRPARAARGSFIIHPDGLILTSGHVVAPTRDREALERELRRNGAIAALVRHFPSTRCARFIAATRSITCAARRGGNRRQRPRRQPDRALERRDASVRSAEFARAARARRRSAVLQIDRKRLPSLSLGDSDAVQVGESIWSVGYPAVASKHGRSDRRLALARQRPRGDVQPRDDHRDQAQRRKRAGVRPTSRSTTATLAAPPSAKTAKSSASRPGATPAWEQIKFLVPVNVAKQLLFEAKIAASAGGEFNQTYHAALEAAGNGEWLEAKKKLVLATALFPRSPDLLRFGNDADRAIRKLPPWKLYPAATVAALCAVIGLLASAMFFVMRRMRPMRPMSPMGPMSPIGLIPETVLAPNGAAPSSMLGRFTILNGTRAGEKLGLGGSGIRIGRESTICEIVLENPKVSRLHAEVVSIDGKTLLIDRNSSNGTYVNDQKIDKRFLQDGDIIYFGGRNAVAVAFHV